MRTVIAAAVFLLLLSHSAPAQQAISCSDFRQNDDGSWTPLKIVTISGPKQSAQFGPDESLRAGIVVKGVDLAGLLDVMCAMKGR